MEGRFPKPECINCVCQVLKILLQKHTNMVALFVMLKDLLLVDLYKLSFPVARFLSHKNFLMKLFPLYVHLNHFYIKIKLTNITGITAATKH